MSTKITLPQVQYIRYKGVVDFHNLWKVIIDWLESKSFEVQENKAKRGMQPFGEVLEVQMTGWRNVTEYYRFEILVWQKYWDCVPVEVVQNGVKKKLMKGRFFFFIQPNLILDYSDRYEKSRLTKAFGDFLYKYIYKWQIDAFYGDQLMYKVYELADVIKENLNVRTKGTEFADMW